MSQDWKCPECNLWRSEHDEYCDCGVAKSYAGNVVPPGTKTNKEEKTIIARRGIFEFEVLSRDAVFKLTITTLTMYFLLILCAFALYKIYGRAIVRGEVFIALFLSVFGSLMTYVGRIYNLEPFYRKGMVMYVFGFILCGFALFS